VIDKKDNIKRIQLKFDLEECKKFIEAKIDFQIFKDDLIRRPRVLQAVIRLKESVREKVEGRMQRLPFEKKIENIRVPEKPKKPKGKRTTSFSEHSKFHDGYLMQVIKLFLEKHGFYELKGILGIFRGYIPDFIGVKHRKIILIEAKTNRLGEGVFEAREAFGQVHDYLRYLKTSKFINNNYSVMYKWIAFENQPDERVIHFLEHYNILVSWVENNLIILSENSQKHITSY
jgi:Holliday junction resolvase